MIPQMGLYITFATMPQSIKRSNSAGMVDNGALLIGIVSLSRQIMTEIGLVDPNGLLLLASCGVIRVNYALQALAALNPMGITSVSLERQKRL